MFAKISKFSVSGHLAVSQLLAERRAEREEMQAREGHELHRHELLDGLGRRGLREEPSVVSRRAD